MKINTYITTLNYPHPVGLKLPKAFGLHDIHGKLWEWCQDITHNDYKGVPTNGSPGRVAPWPSESCEAVAGTAAPT